MEAIRDLTEHLNNGLATARLRRITDLLAGRDGQTPEGVAGSIRQVAAESARAVGQDGATQGARAVRDRSVGRLHAISLAALSAAYGSEWQHIALRAMQAAECIIKRHLGPRDVFSRGDDQDFIIWFEGEDEQRHESRLNRMVRQIRVSFLLEHGARVAEAVGAVMVTAGSADDAPQSGAPRITDMLAARLLSEGRKKEAEAALFLTRLSDSPRPDVQPVVGRDLKGRPFVLVDLQPQERRTLSALSGFPGANPEQAFLADLLRVDLGKRELNSNKGCATVLAPIAWDALVQPHARKLLDYALQTIGLGLRQRLTLVVTDVPPFADPRSWSDVTAPLRRIISDPALALTADHDVALEKYEPIVASWPFSLLVIDASGRNPAGPLPYRPLIGAARARGLEVLVRTVTAHDLHGWSELDATMFTAAADRDARAAEPAGSQRRSA